jgi:hypothetical protein
MTKEEMLYRFINHQNQTRAFSLDDEKEKKPGQRRMKLTH